MSRNYKILMSHVLSLITPAPDCFFFLIFQQTICRLSHCFTYRLYFRTTIEQLQNEINLLDSRIKKVRKQIDLPSTETEIKSQMIEFLQVI